MPSDSLLVIQFHCHYRKGVGMVRNRERYDYNYVIIKCNDYDHKLLFCQKCNGYKYSYIKFVTIIISIIFEHKL